MEQVELLPKTAKKPAKEGRKKMGTLEEIAAWEAKFLKVLEEITNFIKEIQK